MLKATYSIESLSSGAVCSGLSEAESISLLESLGVPFSEAANACRDVFVFWSEQDGVVRSLAQSKTFPFDDSYYLIDGVVTNV